MPPPIVSYCECSQFGMPWPESREKFLFIRKRVPWLTRKIRPPDACSLVPFPDKGKAIQSANKDERFWGMLSHLTTFSAFFTVIGGIICPLAIWLAKKDDSEFVAAQAKESLNFQISIFIYYIIFSFLCFFLIGFPLLFGLLIFQIIVVIRALMQASNGEEYRYPLTLRFIK